MIDWKIVLFPALIYAWSATISCRSGERDKNYPNTDRFDLAQPKVINLPPELEEISGIVYYPKDTSVFAIVDEDGILFKISLNRPNDIKRWEFDKDRDYEDLLLIDSVFYILVSNGDILTVRFENEKVKSTKSNFSDKSKKVYEFESLYLSGDNIILICKSCDIDKKNVVSSFAFHYKDSLPGYSDHLVFNTAPVFAEESKKKHLKVSAAAIDPVSEDIYLISAVEEKLAVFGQQGEFKSVYSLNPRIYKQPEGIAFTPEGDLIIANEWSGTGSATLLLIRNKLK